MIEWFFFKKKGGVFFLEYFVVIGGSTSQVPFVRAAQSLGYPTVVFDRYDDCPSGALADKSFALSTHDAEGIEKVCDSLKEESGLAGIMTYSSEKEPLLIVARLAVKYGLPSFSPEAVAGCLDKDKMMDCFKGVVPTTRSIAFAELDSADTLEDFSYPVIVKPSKGTQGSLGVSFVRAEAQLKDALAVAKSCSQDSVVIIEEFCEGRQFSLDGVVIKGEPSVLSVSEKFTLGKDEGFVIFGFAAGRFPASDAELADNIQAMQEAAVKAAAALKIDNSFFNVDMILSSDGPVVIECGLFLDAKVDRLLSFAGLDLYSLFCSVATGRAAGKAIADLDLLADCAAALVFFFADKPGTLMIEATDCEQEDCLIEWERRSGDSVRPPESISDTLGWVIAKGLDQGEAYAKAREISDGLPYKVI